MTNVLIFNNSNQYIIHISFNRYDIYQKEFIDSEFKNQMFMGEARVHLNNAILAIFKIKYL